MSHRYHPDARAELFAAAEWYEREQAGLGVLFDRRVQEALAHIAAQPLAAPLWTGLATEAPVRRMLVRQFPFALAYLVEPDTHALTVVAVAHLKRHPTYWLQRVLH